MVLGALIAGCKTLNYYKTKDAIIIINNVLSSETFSPL